MIRIGLENSISSLPIFFSKTLIILQIYLVMLTCRHNLGNNFTVRKHWSNSETFIIIKKKKTKSAFKPEKPRIQEIKLKIFW